MDAETRAQLSRAYEILLARPLASFDPRARYDLWCYIEPDLLQDEPLTELAAEALATPLPDLAPVHHDSAIDWSEWWCWWRRYRIDWGRSLFGCRKDEREELPAALADRLCVEGVHDSIHDIDAVTGSQLERMIGELELDRSAVLAHNWLVVRRVVTDGTLTGCLDAATLAMSAPAGLLSYASLAGSGQLGQIEQGDVPAPTATGPLAELSDTALREHLVITCYDDCTGGRLLREPSPGWRLGPVASVTGSRLLATWDDHQGLYVRGLFVSG